LIFLKHDLNLQYLTSVCFCYLQSGPGLLLVNSSSSAGEERETAAMGQMMMVVGEKMLVVEKMTLAVEKMTLAVEKMTLVEKVTLVEKTMTTVEKKKLKMTLVVVVGKPMEAQKMTLTGMETLTPMMVHGSERPSMAEMAEKEQ
jgi:hypothetical protein